MNELQIIEIESKVIFNSKGNKTIETDVYTENGYGRASAPIGTSAGKNEVTQMPEKPEKLIKKAEEELYPSIVGMSADNQEKIDERIKEKDGTEKLDKYGAAITLPLSIAVAKAAAETKNQPIYFHLNQKEEYLLPQPLGKLIGGGQHAGKGPEIQEFLSIPTKTSSIKESCQINVMMQENVKKILEKKDKYFTAGKDLESGYTTTLGNEDALEIIQEARKETKRQIEKNTDINSEVEIKLGIDVAASEFYENGKYIYRDEERTPEEQLKYIKEIIDKYDLEYIEDPFQEEDFENHAKLTKEKPEKTICGDDIFTTNVKLLEKGIKKKACNTVLIKPNQVGTITDTKKTIEKAKEDEYTTVISHRSGETNDSFIAHLAIAEDIPIIKTGITGGERIAKLNELIRTEYYMRR
ncbi:MAG: phosphopyruvate hydratase [archaeon]